MFKSASGIALSTNPSPTDPQVLEDFVEFISNFVSSAFGLIAGASLILSPDEEKKRELLMTLYDAIITMMETVQTTVATNSELAHFYAKLSAEYVKMGSRVPLYLGKDSPLPHVNLTDLSKFTLGYDNISVAEIINYIILNPFVKNTDGTDSTTPQTFSVVYSASVDKALRFTINPAGTGSFVVDYLDHDIVQQSFSQAFPTNATIAQKTAVADQVFLQAFNNPTVQAAVGLNANSPDYSQSLLDAENTGDSFIVLGNVTFRLIWNADDEVVSLVAKDGITGLTASAFNQSSAPVIFYQSMPADPDVINASTALRHLLGIAFSDATVKAAIGAGTPYIRWRYTGEASGSQYQDPASSIGAMVKSRAAANQKELQIGQHASAMKDTVDNRANQIQNVIQASQTQLQQTDSLLQSIIAQLRNIIDAIIKRK